MIQIPNKNQNQRAFTLIELLVVISIIGLLSSVVLAAVNGARSKGAIAAGQKFDSHTHSAFFDDLVLEWDFDNSIVGNVVQDRSSNGNDLTMSGSLLQETPKLFGTGKVIRLSYGETAASAFSIKSPATSGGFSVSFWVNLTESNKNAVLLNYDYGFTAGTWKLSVSNSSVLSFVVAGDRGGANASAGILNPNQWYNVTAICDNGKIGVYLNGKLASNVSLGANCVFAANKKLYLSTYGGNNTDQTFFLDNVRIYDRALPLSFIESQHFADLPESRLLVRAGK